MDKYNSNIGKMKFRLTLFSLFFILSTQILGQNPVIPIYWPLSGTQDIVARDAVILQPGFSYVGTAGNSFTARTDHKIVTYSDYLYGTDIPDPETRILNTSYSVGTTNGSFNVNPLGGASYSIPLEVPAGVNGLSPSLSINYSSNSGTGVVGFGWQIGGLSAISRGPQTFYNDGSASGVNLDINDRFYLDGQRLVTTSGNYGEAGAQYQTDLDIFTRVTQSNDGNGPAWFKAETKSGLVYEYGNSTDSKQVLTGFPQVVNWNVSKISDLFGNQITYTYIQDHLLIYPSEINYGLNNISFYYKQRNDQSISFLKGVKIEQWLLLDKIVIKYNGKVVKTYEFNQSFQGSNYNSYSILNEVIEYGIGSSRLNSTAYSYQVPANIAFSLATYNTTNQYVNYNSLLIPGDYNGDGKTDFFCLPDASKGATWTGVRIYFGDGNDNFPTYISNTNSIDLQVLKDIYSTDLTGDGKDDIVFEIGDINISVFNYILCSGTTISNPINFWAQVYNSGFGLFGKRRRMIEKQQNDNVQGGSDFNGDGVNDLLIISPTGDWRVVSFVNSAGQMTSTLNILGTGNISSLATEVLSGDFNGDGKSEIWSFESSQLKIYSFTSGTLNLLYTYAYASKQHFFTLGDFNADGKVDLFEYGYGRDGTEVDWPDWYIRLSTGIDFENHSFPQKKANLKDDYVRMGDFNGDGATDIMVTSGNNTWNGTYFYISKNNGTDFYTHNIPNYPSATHNFSVGDFDGDGHSDFICTDGAAVWWTGYQLYRTTGNTAIQMEKVANGLGLLTKLTYSKLSKAASSVYQKGTGATYPVMDFQGALNVVTTVRIDNGIGTKNEVDYYYEGAKIHLQGKGFLCYTKTRTTDVAAGIENESVFGYSYDFYYPQQFQTLSRRRFVTETVEETVNYFGNIVLDGPKKRIFAFIENSVHTNYLTGLSSTEHSYYDTHGNLTTISKSYSNGPTETTTNEYNDERVDPTHWLLGRPTSTTTTYMGFNPSFSRSGTRVFDANNNHLTSETWHSGTNNQITKSFAYYTFGALQSETATANGMPRTKSYTYLSDNTRVYTLTDQLGHASTNSYDTYGRLAGQQDFLGNSSSTQYDEFNRPIFTATSDGNQQTNVYAWTDTLTVPYKARYSVIKSGNDGSQSKTWFDKLGREVRSDVKGFDGTMIYTATVYNTKGQVESVTEPYYPNETPMLNSYLYDTYGRKSSLSRPSGRNTTWAYNTNSVTETTGGKSFTKTFASNGTISSASDAGGTILYTYFDDGKVKTITAPGGIVSSMHYDIAGNQDLLVDPSAGTISYTYNGFGELTDQTNGRSQTTHIDYYSDGRILQKSSIEGTSTYFYNYTKQVTSIISPGGISRTFGYDTKGRVISTTESIPGSVSFTTSVTYDDKGRNSTITHPSGLTETNNYNSNGFLSSISADGTIRWTTTGVNARQQVTNGLFGNNLAATFGFDPYGYPTSTTAGSIQEYVYSFNTVTGNLNNRENKKYSLKEDFNYDNLDRLDDVKRGGIITLDMSYDGTKGGISTKNDVGSMVYDYPGKPYAIGTFNTIAELNLPTPQLVNYTSFESISSISENGYSASFVYNSDDERAKIEVLQGTTALLTRWYPSDSYIKETLGGVTKEYTFIGGDAYTAPVVAISQNGTLTWYYILRDYLGSITHIVNASNGTLNTEYSFDAWGRMRNPSTWTNYAPGSEPTLFVAGRGYTSHEHLPWFNLINMNGRVYDALLGQFLSPDNNVQTSELTQNFNRFSYCMNNPLKFTDPDGELWNLIIGGLIGGTFNWITHGCQFNGKGLGYFATGAVSGALAAGVGAGMTASMSGSTFGAGFIGSKSAMTAISSNFSSSFFRGALIGSSSGFSGGFSSGFGNALVDGNNFNQALRLGCESGASGALYGGLTGGISGGIGALIQGRRFFDGATVSSSAIESPIDILGQKGNNNCIAANASAVDKSFGGSLSQDDVRGLFGGDPNLDPLMDNAVWDKYATLTGHKVVGENGNSSSLFHLYDRMKQGERVSLTLNKGGNVGHSVVMKSITQKDITKINGNSFSRLIYRVMDPGNGGSFHRINRNSIINSYHLFFIK